MIATLTRKIVTPRSTIGLLVVNDKLCDTLEDAIRPVKISGETCIPPGQYVLKLRTDGSKSPEYLERFGPDFHKGMLWLQDVPGFEYIYIHIGNSPDDTKGCILVGSTVSTDFIGGSEAAYREIYPVLAGAILAGDDVLIDVVNPTD
jgi:hypothetical protein